MYMQFVADHMQNIAGRPGHIDDGLTHMLKHNHRNKRLHRTNENASAREMKSGVSRRLFELQKNEKYNLKEAQNGAALGLKYSVLPEVDMEQNT